MKKILFLLFFLLFSGTILPGFAQEKSVLVQLDEVAIIGDDLNDLPVMQAVGLAVCPASAVSKVKSAADIILSRKGGDACVREFIDNYLL